jgi:hypothetical protein
MLKANLVPKVFAHILCWARITQRADNFMSLYGFLVHMVSARLSNGGLERGVIKGASEMVKGRRKMQRDVKMSGWERA